VITVFAVILVVAAVIAIVAAFDLLAFRFGVDSRVDAFEARGSQPGLALR
jgi:hypothetical protein